MARIATIITETTKRTEYNVFDSIACIIKPGTFSSEKIPAVRLLSSNGATKIK